MNSDQLSVFSTYNISNGSGTAMALHFTRNKIEENCHLQSQYYKNQQTFFVRYFIYTLNDYKPSIASYLSDQVVDSNLY